MNRREITFKFLKNNSNIKYTVSNLAKEIFNENKDLKIHYIKTTRKGAEPIKQFQAEIGSWFSQKTPTLIKLIEEYEIVREKSSDYNNKYVYYSKSKTNKNQNQLVKTNDQINKIKISKKSQQFSEHDLYPILSKFLKEKQKIYTKRIDERKSSNKRGQNGNKWLHPDIVGLKVIAEDFTSPVKKLMEESNDNPLICYSYEVKKELSISNLRESFFQTVSNSKWANEAYLVAASYKDEIMEELSTLCQLHGVGFIHLNYDDVNKSKIIIQAQNKKTLDWNSIDRLSKENKDFEEFVNILELYYRAGHLDKTKLD